MGWVSHPPTPRPTRGTSLNKVGIHLLLDDGRNQWGQHLWRSHLEHAATMVGEWGYVTQLVRVDDLDPIRWQHFLDLCQEFRLTPIIRLATTFNQAKGWWNAPSADLDGSYGLIASQYAEFARQLDFPTDEHYFIIGNEPNHGNEWSGRPNPIAYARFLLDVSKALHTADPFARVLNAGLDLHTLHTGSRPFVDGMYYMDAETFLDEMVAAYPHVFQHIDAWASHPYPAHFIAPPWEQTYARDMLNDAYNPHHQAPPAGIYNRGINGYAWELWKLSTYGITNLPVMITETGWRHAEATTEQALDTGTNYPDSATVETYFRLSFYGSAEQTGWTPWLADQRLIAVTPFALNGLPSEWGHTNWLKVDDSGHISGQYFSLPANKGS